MHVEEELPILEEIEDEFHNPMDHEVDFYLDHNVVDFFSPIVEEDFFFDSIHNVLGETLASTHKDFLVFLWEDLKDDL